MKVLPRMKLDDMDEIVSMVKSTTQMQLSIWLISDDTLHYHPTSFGNRNATHCIKYPSEVNASLVQRQQPMLC
jgi:hypothetical protein